MFSVSWSRTCSFCCPDRAYSHIYEKAFGVGVVPLLQKIHMPRDIVIGHGRFRLYNQLSKDLVRLLAIFPGLQEVTVGTLRSICKSRSKRTRTNPKEMYAIMRKPTVKRVKAMVDDAIAKEKRLRIG
jgi:hypothetical protein